MPNKVLFCADHMLGRLCKWLRFMGFDVLYPRNELGDNEIMKLCSKEGRILLTRDNELYSRTPGSILILSVSIEEQVLQVLRSFTPDPSLYFTKCPECNNELKEASGLELRDKLPPKIEASGEKVWKCDNCGKVYWQGTHYDRIREQLKKYEEECQE